jgi:drug/metabolite transporter (DMT)-like permease
MPALKRYAVPAAFIGLGLIWGSSFLWIKIAVDELGAATLAAERITIGAVIVLVFLRVVGMRMPSSAAELAPLAVVGLLNAAVPYILISWGETVVDSGTAAVLNSLTPMFSLLIAGLYLRVEPVTLLRTIGLVVGFAGAALLATRELELRDDPAALVGAGAVVVAALSYAVAASYARHHLRVTHRYVVSAGTLVFGALFSWPVALLTDGFQLPTQPDTIVSVLWLGVMGAFVAYLLYFFLIAELGATLASMVTYVFPVVGVALGVLVLRELLDLRLAVGTVLVVAGIAIVSLRYDAAVSRAARGSSS